MKKTIFILTVVLLGATRLNAQKIIPIEHNGKKYEVLDMSEKGKIQWGGNEQIPADAAKSESDGGTNTVAIVLAVGDNPGYENKPYPAKICSEANNGGKDDWYLPSKDESDAIYAFKDKFPKIEERGTIWTSSETSGTTVTSKYWYSGAYYNVMKVDFYQFVCIRKAE